MNLLFRSWVLVPVLALAQNDLHSESCTSPETCASDLKRRTLSSPDCQLYMGTSNSGGLGVFSGVNINKPTQIGRPEMVVSIIDPNKREKSLWHDFVWAADMSETLVFENKFIIDAFVPGLGTHIQCHETWANVKHEQDSQDSAGVHRSTHPSAGSFSYRQNYTTHSIRKIKKGQELFVNCNGDQKKFPTPPAPKSSDWLKRHAICIDTLKPGVSTIPGAGRGAFTSRFTGKGAIVASSPVIHFDKREMDMMEQDLSTKLGGATGFVYNATKIIGQQLLTNYLFGHPNSPVALLPTSPVVNFINHSPEPNVAIQWGSIFFDKSYLDKVPAQLLSEGRGLAIDYVALRDIGPDEELFLDYGLDWTSAWEDHVGRWEASDPSYLSASDYTKLHQGEVFRTTTEQKTKPYPDNIRTACVYKVHNVEGDEAEEEEFEIEWEVHHIGCLRPCDIVERVSNDGSIHYTAMMHTVGNLVGTYACFLSPTQTHVVTNVPANQIKLVDRSYSTDQYLPGAFRHMIGVPPLLYPQIWMDTPIREADAFANVPLKANEISQVRWAKTNETVSKYAFRIGLDKKISETLLNYCNRVGITDAFKQLLIDGNPLTPGTDLFTPFGGYNWYVQRPESHWKSNMHWISPADEDAHDDYLRILSEGGFDSILDEIGKHFGLDGLVAYHVTFIGVSHCSKGFMHHDFKDIDGKAFNIIIPLILANKTGPELDLRQDGDEWKDDLPVGSYKYEHNVANIVGDMAKHATAACDYRDNKEMRMAATVYIADVNPKNLKRLMIDFTQAFPPADDPEHLLRRAATNWKPDGSVKLPKPFIASDMAPVAVGEIAPMKWAVGTLTKYADRIGLPLSLIDKLRSFITRMTMVDYFHGTLIFQDYLKPGGREPEVFRGFNWFIQRPADNSLNLHWLIPGDEAAHDNFLTVLSAGGFDQVIDRIGVHYELDSLTVYSVAIMGVSRNARSFDRLLPDSGGKIFKILIPISLGENVGPELEIWSNDRQTMGPYHFEDDVGIIIGDGAIHSVAKCDYRVDEEMQMVVEILLADISKDNVNAVLDTLELSYLRNADAQNLLEKAGLHWKKADSLKKLPIPVTTGDFIANSLQPNEISQLRWLGNGEAPSEFAFRVGLPEILPKTLLDYCDRTGITEAFRKLQIDGEPLEPGSHRYDQFGGYEWYVQRPHSFWHSNMHWISPADEETHKEYLRILSAGGFDEILNSIGTYFDLDGLSVYHVTFIGVSHCETGYMHYDFKETQGKAFNVIIPLILANETGPELDILPDRSDDDRNLIGQYKYQPNVASMVGDLAYHATAAVNYLENKEMRMAATVYIADLNDANAQSIVDDFTQAYPPRGDVDFLLSQAGAHWHPTDKSKRLPTPFSVDADIVE